MLVNQILFENDITNKIQNDLMDFLLAYRQADVNSVDIFGPNGAISYLRNLGHDIDEDTIDDLLDNSMFDEVVERSTDTDIELKPEKTEPTVSPDEEAKSQEKVDKTAAKVAKQAVKTGDKI